QVWVTTIPPEADINAPDWYTLVDGQVNVQFYANARWAPRFGYSVEVAQGVEPTSFTTLATASGIASDPGLSSADLVSNFTASWNTTALSNGLYTLRLRVTDNRGNQGEDRMAVWVRHHDQDDQPGFPRHFDGSLETLSVATVDLDGDNKLEIIFGDGNGEVHAVRSDGTDLPGFPVHTDLPAGLPLTKSDAFVQNLVPISYAAIIGGVAVANLDRDGQQEIVAAADDGKVYCWHADATPGGIGGSGRAYVIKPNGTIAPGWPVKPTSINPNSVPLVAQGVVTSPVVADLDGNGTKEIALGCFLGDATVYNADGSTLRTL